ncbi:MAG: RNA-binding protein [Hyphococcus sp.]
MLTPSPDTDAPAPPKPLRRGDRERTCVATGETISPDRLLRFVLGPDGALAPDFTGKLPGRGAWVTARREMLEAALRKGAFARSFQQPAPAAADLADRVEAGLAKLALGALGIARKAGDAVIGFDQVKAALKDNGVAVLIAASDGGEDGRRKLKGLAGGLALIECFDSAALAAALGRDHVVHAALKSSAAADRFLRAAGRLEGFRA